MIVFRLCKSTYGKDLSGKGAEKTGGRWNSRGVPMLYTGESRALCTTEIAVYTPLGIMPMDYHLISIKFPDNLLSHLDKKLPKDWNTFPHSHSTQIIGDTFIAEGKFLAMRVPSVIVHGEYNILLNPSHKAFSKVKVVKSEPFEFNERLFLKP